MIEGVDAGKAFAAHPSLAHRIGRISLELNDLAVLHMRDDTAVGDARPAGRINDMFLILYLDVLRLTFGKVMPA